MKTNLMEVALDDNFLIHNLAMEARNLEIAIEEQMTALLPQASTGLSFGWNIGLESQEEEVPEEKKKGILKKMWEFVIRFFRRLREAYIRHNEGADAALEYKLANRAKDILKNKKNQNDEFAKAVVAKLSDSARAVLSAVENNKSFIPQFNKNIQITNLIQVPGAGRNIDVLLKFQNKIADIDTSISQLSELIKEASSQEPAKRDAALLDALSNGISISGSENADYLKAFENAAEGEKKYEQMIKFAEDCQKNNEPQETVEAMKKVAAMLAQQFSLEARVVDAFTKLNKAVIAYNEKLHEGV